MKQRTLSFFLLLFIANFALAASSPVPMLQQRANNLIKSLQQNKAKIKSNPKLVYNLVESNVLPIVDQQRMARSVVANSLWRKANTAERQAFINQFRKLVLRTYAAAFSQYKNETIRFRPVKISANAKTVTVQSAIQRPGRQSITVDYSVVRQGASWKVYDFTVDGVSMVNSFRAQLASLNKKSLAALTRFITKHNAKTA